MYCLFSCASELPDSGREQGQTCQNTARKDVADHRQEILKVPRDGLFLGDFHTESASLVQLTISPMRHVLEQYSKIFCQIIGVLRLSVKPYSTKACYFRVFVKHELKICRENLEGAFLPSRNGRAGRRCASSSSRPHQN